MLYEHPFSLPVYIPFGDPTPLLHDPLSMCIGDITQQGFEKKKAKLLAPYQPGEAQLYSLLYPSPLTFLSSSLPLPLPCFLSSSSPPPLPSPPPPSLSLLFTLYNNYAVCLFQMHTCFPTMQTHPQAAYVPMYTVLDPKNCGICPQWVCIFLVPIFVHFWPVFAPQCGMCFLHGLFLGIGCLH